MNGFSFKQVDWGVGDQTKHIKTRKVKLHVDKYGTLDDAGDYQVCKTVDGKKECKENDNKKRRKGGLYFELQESKGKAKVFICPQPSAPNPNW